jgi:hypothetical protein
MLMMRPRHKLTADERDHLREVLGRCEILRAVNELVSDFAGMARARQGQHLNAWIAAAQASDIAARGRPRAPRPRQKRAAWLEGRSLDPCVGRTGARGVRPHWWQAGPPLSIMRHARASFATA